MHRDRSLHQRLEELGNPFAFGVIGRRGAQDDVPRSAADGPLRRRFARAGGHSLTSVALVAWEPGQATVESTLTSEQTQLDADALVIAETPVAETALGDALTAAGIAHRQIGDCVSPRRASLAFYEARELARRL